MYKEFLDVKTIGILGGTFNPVHSGHIALAKAALDEINELDRVLLMPNSLPAYKDSTAIISREHRMKMLDLAIEDISDDRVMSSSLELDRGGMTYTYDTLVWLKENHPNLGLYFIIGDDSFLSLHMWKNYKALFEMTSFIVMLRDADIEAVNMQYNRLCSDVGEHLVDVQFLNAPRFKASSSYIRESFSRGENDKVMAMLPQNVFEYISNNDLYKRV